MDDWTQLEAYVEQGDEQAFASLVSRHIGLVYGAAFRKLENSAAAEEVAQSVFILLAKKSSGLRRSGTSLAPWLYATACRHAIDLYRHEAARKRREKNHAMSNESPISSNDAAWSEIAPALEEAMQSLGKKIARLSCYAISKNSRLARSVEPLAEAKRRLASGWLGRWIVSDFGSIDAGSSVPPAP